MKGPNVSVKQIQYLVSAAKYGSYKKAAEVLRVSASSISLAISQLEETIGVQLFERRHARGLVLTDRGREKAIEARNILQRLDEFQQDGSMDSPELTGGIEVGVLISLSPFLFPVILQEFQEEFPSIDVKVREGYIEELVAGLTSGSLDLAITFDTDLPSAIITHPILELKPKVLISSAHPLAKNSTISLGALSEMPYILADYSNTRDYIFSVFSECGLSAPNVSQRVQSYELLRNLVGRGFGYAIVNISPPFGNDPDAPVTAVDIEEPVRVPVLSVASLRRIRLDPAIKSFIENAQSAIRERYALHE